jgi:hypothetical protein
MSKMKLTVQQSTHKSFVSLEKVAAFNEVIDFESQKDPPVLHRLRKQDLVQITEIAHAFIDAVSTELNTNPQAFLAAVEKGDVFLGNN